MNWRRLLDPRRWDWRLVWDLLMVWIATVNLVLIVFDLTYLPLRPAYRSVIPLLTRVYDPVKGIAPHPLTEQLNEEAAASAQLVALDPAAPGLRERVERLRALTLRVLEENPFERSGQSHSLELIKVLVAHETRGTTLGLDSRQAQARMVEELWPDDDPDLLARRLALFDEQIRPLLAGNYFREFDVRGRLTDHFWIIDLPFLTLFIVEFAIRWALALRRRTYARWFFFPIFNWYDLLGLMPVTALRVFRLFRIASIYMRLRRSEATKVGKDVLSRAVAYVSNIIAEEISDMVALRILSETQDEIRDGTHVRIFDQTFSRHREHLQRVAAEALRDLADDRSTQERLRELLRLNLETAVERTRALRSVPLPQAVLRPLVRGVGEAVLDATVEAVTLTLASDDGRRAVEELVGTLLDRLLAGPGRDAVQQLSEEISLDALEQIKAAVAVKKWALPTPRPADEPTPTPLPASED